MSDTIQFRVDPLEGRLIRRAAERDNESASELIRRAIRREIDAPPRGRLYLDVSPHLASALLDKAARMGYRSGQLVEALIRDHLDDLDEFDLDPELRRARARQRAKELLNG